MWFAERDPDLLMKMWAAEEGNTGDQQEETSAQPGWVEWAKAIIRRACR